MEMIVKQYIAFQLRTRLGKLVAQLPIFEPQYLEQSNELMRTLLKAPEEIEIEALVRT